MNKHTQVALIEYNEDVQAITNIYEIPNIDYAPLFFYNEYHNASISNVKAMNQWFQGRAIPVQNLKGLPEEYYVFLKSFQTKMEYKNKEWSDERLKKLKDGLSTRIDLFEKEIRQI